MMIFDYRRVAEIWVPDSERETGERGTGYLLCDGCLLTAFHVIKKRGQAGIKFRTLGQYEIDPEHWIETSNVPWTNESFDLALVQFATQSQNFLAIPWTRSVPVNHEISCQAQGFPRFRERKDENINKNIFDPYLAKGIIPRQVNPKKPGELLINIQGAKPNKMEHWKGLSGAALFSQDGYLLGTVIQGPEQLGGTQLEAIALETVIREDPSFNNFLHQEFERKLFCSQKQDPGAEDEFNRHMESVRVRVKKRELKHQLIDLEDIADTLKDGLIQNETTQGPSRIKRLFELLDEIRGKNSDLIWETWRNNPSRKTIQINLEEFEEIYSILNDENQVENYQQFLAQIYAKLQDPSHQLQEYLIPFRDLTQDILQIKLDEIEIAPPVQPLQISESTQSSCWILLIDDKSAVNQEEKVFEVSSWLIANRQLYRDSLDEQGNPTLESKKYTQFILDAEDFTVNAKTRESLETELKANLSRLITQLWENPSLEIMKNKPELVFYLPKSLMSIDFESIEFGLLNTLGLELSVSISILDRYKQTQSFRKYREYWIERWDILKRYCNDSIRSHMEIYDHHGSNSESPVDVSCPRKLRKWLLKQDLTREADRKVVGFGFFVPYSEFYDYLENLVVNGLSVMVWPKTALAEETIGIFESKLDVPPQSIANSIKEFRINHSEDAGPIALWMDDPYCPPPDPEVYNG